MVNLVQSGKESLDKVVAQLTTENATPGFVVGATTADEELYFNAGGYKTYNDLTSGEIDKDAVFWVCSMTKLIAHIAALQLVDQGKLSPEDSVSKYFPQFANPVVIENVFAPTYTFKPAQNAVLVKHLLNFSSGLFYRMTPDFGIAMPPEYTGEHINKEDPHGEFFSILQGDLPGIPLAFEPGTDFVYGFSSDVLGFIVEKISGKTLDEYMKENIFKPLNMKASFFLTQDLKKRLFSLYLRTEDGALHLWNNQPGTKILEHDPTKVSRLFGGVGLYTSLRDYLKLLRHLLQIHDGKADNPILKQETVKAMFVPSLTEKGSQSLDTLLSIFATVKGHSWGNAFATCNTDYPNGRKKGSGFWSGWAGTHFFIDPTTGVAAVFGTQISSLTSGAADSAVLKVLAKFEETLYANLA